MMRDGKCYRQPKLERPISEIGSGLWHTVTTQEIEHPDMEISETGRRMTLDGGDSHSLCLADKVQIGVTHYLPDGCPSYPTPIKWPTPQEDDSSNVHPSDKRSPTLVKAVDRLPTPTRRDWKGARKPETLKAKGRDERNSLPDAIEYQNGGQLNPDWVEWLMGWPIGWTSLQTFEWGNWQTISFISTFCL